jgi:hypothetical protein
MAATERKLVEFRMDRMDSSSFIRIRKLASKRPFNKTLLQLLLI